MQLETVRSLINSLQAQARSQSARSEASAECVDLIVGVSHKIDMLSLETNILSLNASIEASRDEPSAHAFGVVADEMRRLSREIATANAEVHELGERLAQLLPAIASGARAIADEADTFASLSASRGETVKTAIATLNSRVGASIEASAATVRDVIGAAQEAVSHLQFQDVTAQALRCGDAILHEAYTRVLASMGAEERAQELAEPVYRTLGTANDPTVAVASVDAGEVTLF